MPQLVLQGSAGESRDQLVDLVAVTAEDSGGLGVENIIEKSGKDRPVLCGKGIEGGR